MLDSSELSLELLKQSIDIGLCTGQSVLLAIVDFLLELRSGFFIIHLVSYAVVELIVVLVRVHLISRVLIIIPSDSIISNDILISNGCSTIVFEITIEVSFVGLVDSDAIHHDHVIGVELSWHSLHVICVVLGHDLV